jgi:hypothetical protein
MVSLHKGKFEEKDTEYDVSAFKNRIGCEIFIKI